jgi:L-arabinose isomerase
MALAQGPNGWRLIATTGTIERFGPLASMYVPHFKLCLSGDVRQFLSDYAQAGGPHHNAVCFGDARRRLRLLAQLMGAEYYEI